MRREHSPRGAGASAPARRRDWRFDRTSGAPAANAVADIGMPDYLRVQLERTLQFDEPEALIATMVAVQNSGRPPSRCLPELHNPAPARDAESSAYRRKIWMWTRMLLVAPEVEARQVACALLDAFWKDHRKEVEKLTLNLARDEEHEVRLYAGQHHGAHNSLNFRSYFRYMRLWSRHADPSVRRQVIIATVAVADSNHPEWARPLLDLLEPHMSDRDPYIRPQSRPLRVGPRPAARVSGRDARALRALATVGRRNRALEHRMAFATPVIPVDAHGHSPS